MKRLSLRRRVLFGGLVLAGIIGAVDRLSGSATPTPAEAALAASAGPSADIAPAPDVADLVQRVTANPYTSIAGDLARVERDLFVPTPTVDTLFAAFEPEDTPAAVANEGAAPAAAPPPLPPPTFGGPHRLVGVLLGAVPLAVIDEQVLPVGAELDGFRLVRIERDRVVLRHPQSEHEIALTLEPPTDKR